MYRVVLVDDEQLILEGLSKVVKWAAYGCEVIGTARDGKEGLALIRQEKPDIVFSDIRMPNMDGLTMLAALRSEFPHMLVTVLTAYRDFDYAQKALHLGVHRYLLKPSKMDELNEAIRTGKLSLLAIYTEGDEEVWHNALPTLPDTWLVGTDHSQIKEKALYDLKAMPCLYLLDAQKHVLVKDGEYESILN